MNFAIITDTHYGARKGSQVFHDYFEKFYSEIFFPTLDDKNIKTVVHMGDVFDNRKGTDYWSLEWAKRVVFDPLRERGITSYVLVGNHDAYYKNTNSINSVDILLSEYNNIIPVSKIGEYNIHGLNTLLIPWICSDNSEKSLSMISSSKSKVAMGHLDLNGFEAYKGHIQKSGMDPDIFKSFELVLSGHFHTRSDKGKIHYVGNPYEMFWNDLNDVRGFCILNSKTLEIDYINNPFTMFERIVYEDTPIKGFNFSKYNNKIVKVVVNKKTKIKNFENFIDRLYKSNIHELKIIESIEIVDFENLSEEKYNSSEDTLSILNECIDSFDDDINKSDIKNMIVDIYKDAFEVTV